MKRSAHRRIGMICGSLAPFSIIIWGFAYFYYGVFSSSPERMQLWLLPILILLTVGVLASAVFLLQTSFVWRRMTRAGQEPPEMEKAPFLLCVISLFLPLLFALIIIL